MDAQIAVSERNQGIEQSKLDAQVISLSSKLVLGFAAQILHPIVAQLYLRSILNMNFDYFCFFIYVMKNFFLIYF